MPKQAKKVNLARETLRHLDDPRRPDGPVGTFTGTRLPNDCHTASCKPYIC